MAVRPSASRRTKRPWDSSRGSTTRFGSSRGGPRGCAPRNTCVCRSSPACCRPAEARWPTGAFTGGRCPPRASWDFSHSRRTRRRPAWATQAAQACGMRVPRGARVASQQIPILRMDAGESIPSARFAKSAECPASCFSKATGWCPAIGPRTSRPTVALLTPPKITHSPGRRAKSDLQVPGQSRRACSPRITTTTSSRFGFWDYDAETGRWTARDPLAFAGGDLALYNYAHNDPLNYVDYAGTGPAYRATTAALAIVGGGLLLAGALAVTAPATVAFLALSGVLGIGLGTANLASYQNPNQLPTSPGGIAALGAGNSPTAQNVGAAFDLATGLTPNGLAGAAQAVQNLSNGLSVLGAADKTATAYGLTPGSSSPGGNPSAPRLPALPAGRL